MRRVIPLLLFLFLLLTGCHGGGDEEPRVGAEETVRVILTALDEEDEFHPADPDYLENCFAFEAAPTDAAIFFGEEYGIEIGVFFFADAATAKASLPAVREYLATEEQSVRDLAALYPAEELRARLFRYENAVVLQKGRTVAYFLLEEDDRATAERTFLK
jgi:hypothetical protein